MNIMKKILIVDDSPTMRRMIKASLRTLENVSFEEAENGLEAIERLTIGAIDLVTLDINMPDINGLEVLKFIKSHNSLNNIPIIVLSSRSDEQTCDIVLSAGVARFMNKPFDPHKLNVQVTNLLDNKINAQ